MSKADADILARAWAYILRNGFTMGRTGYRKPGDQCASCALGGLAAAGNLNLDESDEAGYPDDFTYIVGEVPAAKWLVEAQGVKTPSRLTVPHRTYAAERDTAWSIWRHNDSFVKTFDAARDWFAKAIALAEAEGVDEGSQLVAILQADDDEIVRGPIGGFVHVASNRHDDRRWSYTSEEVVRAPSGKLYAFLNETGLTEAQDEGYGPAYHGFNVYQVTAETEWVQRTRYVKVFVSDAEADK